MALIGRFHPVLVHFPIALIVAAFGCELVSMATRLREWHVAAVANLRIGAVFAVGSAIAGWIFARSPMIDASPSLEWHRWAGACATLAAVGAVLSARSSAQNSSRSIWIYARLWARPQRSSASLDIWGACSSGAPISFGCDWRSG